MDDDITFGASVWGANEAVEIPPPSSTSVLPASNVQYDDDHFDDFDGFGPSAQTMHPDLDDDDFGDFGDFGDAEGTGPVSFTEDAGSEKAGPSSAAYEEWYPLTLNPFPSRMELREQVNDILAPIWGGEQISRVMSDEGIRDVGGIKQILVTPESRELYDLLLQSPPSMKPPNWTRSRIRRQHLITLGIPVNLDEVLPQANGKPLPTLQITTRPMSAPPGTRNAQQRNNAIPSTGNNSRAGTPVLTNHPASSHFGPKRELETNKIAMLLELDSDSLTLLPLPALEKHLADLRAQTANTSAVLTHLLQTRESLQQDSETYNRLIAELVGEAQKKTSKSRTTAKRGSGMT